MREPMADCGSEMMQDGIVRDTQVVAYNVDKDIVCRHGDLISEYLGLGLDRLPNLRFRYRSLVR